MFNWLSILLKSFIPRRSFTAKICGHKTKNWGRVKAFGESIATTMLPNKEGGFDYCISCIEKMAIKCSWCKRPIFIGDPITLCAPHDIAPIPEGATIHDKESRTIVGCLRGDCAEGASYWSGFWTPNANGNGYAERIRFPLKIHRSVTQIIAEENLQEK